MNLIPHDLPGALSSMSSMMGHDKELNTLKASDAAEHQLSIQKSADFTLYTQEGDKVTLSSLATLEAGISTYTRQGTLAGEGPEADVEAFHMNAEFELQLSVEGDLNKQEIKDIRRAFTQMRKMVRNLLAGKTEKAMGRVSKLMNFKSISGFEAAYHYARTYSAKEPLEAAADEFMSPPAETNDPVTPAASEDFNPPQTATPPANLTANMASPRPQASTSAQPSASGPDPSGTMEAMAPPTSPAQSSEAQDTEPSLEVEIEYLVEKMASLVVESEVETGKLVKYTSQFLDHISAKYAYDQGENSFEFNLVKKTQMTFMQRFEDKPETGDPSSEVEAPEEKAPEPFTA